MNLDKLVAAVGNPKWFDIAHTQQFVKDSDFIEAPGADRVYAGLKQFATKRGWTVIDTLSPVPDEPDRNTAGMTTFHTRTIWIDGAMGDYRKAVVMAHELAHTVHGRNPTMMESINETFAEAVAFLVAQHYGWPTDDMVAYLTSGAGPEGLEMMRYVLRSVSPRAVKVAQALINDGLAVAA